VGVVSLVWVLTVAPSWLAEWKQNLAGINAPGMTNNPAARTWAEFQVTKTILDLQAAVAVFWPAASVYNAVSYAVCGLLLLAGAAATVGRRLTTEQLWLGLTAVVPLALLAVYHRPYDARLLLLTIPGCAMLARRGGWTGKISTALTLVAIVLTGDLTTTFLPAALPLLHVGTATLIDEIMILLVTRTGVLALLAMSVFHLAVYIHATMRSGTARDGTLVAYGA